MRVPRRTELRLAFAILLVAVLPLMTSIVMSKSLVARATNLYFNPEVGRELERSLGLYSELARALREGMKAKAEAIAEHEPLRLAAQSEAPAKIETELKNVFSKYPDLVELDVFNSRGDLLSHIDRGAPINETLEHTLEVRRPLAETEQAPQMLAVFATPRSRLDDLDRAASLVRTYKLIEKEKGVFEQTYLITFVALVGFTIAVSVFLGFWLSRSITLRINQLAQATVTVAGGDLSVRVAETGNDEISDLAKAFNRMLGEVEESRARIEFLRRIGAWQDMARRLAHEIKNPLTPIQLAVEECHRRYRGEDPSFRKLLDTTLEIVDEEVRTLRRLVTEFSNFARMPRAELSPSDIAIFLADWRSRQSIGDDSSELEAAALEGSHVDWDIQVASAPVALDQELFHRVLTNLLANAAQAIRDQKKKEQGHIRVRLSVNTEDTFIDIEDNGPGIPDDLKTRIFDPYFTTKNDGSGLGLAIVQKIIVEHGGTIEAQRSELGGAKIRITLPKLGTAASDAALRAR